MTRQSRLEPEFVVFIPDALEDGRLYISMKYATVSHLCCCGCKAKVVTPLTPTDWKLMFDGESVSLYPSIGSWGFECQSHYWIDNNRVIWDRSWSRKQIESGRAEARLAKEAFSASRSAPLKPLPVSNRQRRRRILEWLRIKLM